MQQGYLSGQPSHLILGVREHKLRISPFRLVLSNLTNDTSVGYMNWHSVFECVVLIFIMDYQSFLSIVVSFALLLSSKFQWYLLK